MLELKISPEDIFQIVKLFLGEKIETIKAVEGGFEVSIRSSFSNSFDKLIMRLLFSLSNDGAIVITIKELVFN